jgi:segregation and condensation protein B
MTMIRKAIVTSPKLDATGPPADGEAIAALSSSQDRAQPGGTAADQTAERADEIVDQAEDRDGPEQTDPSVEQTDTETEQSDSGAEQADAEAEQIDVEEKDPEEQPAEAQDSLIEVPKTDDIPGAIEALLLLAEEPMSETVLAQAVGAPVHVVADALAELVAFYDETGRGFELRQLGGGWRYYTRAEHADLISGHVLDGAQSRLSQAALETLAVIAYLQPLSRSRVSAIRGVNVDGVIRTLLARGLIVEAGADSETGAVVFATTDYFLERMGLSSLDELPELAPHLPEANDLEAELAQFATISQPAEAEADPEPAPAEAEPGLIDEPESEPDAAGPAATPSSAVSPVSAESPASPDSPESPASPASADSPDSPSSPDTPAEPDPEPEAPAEPATAEPERPVDPAAGQDAHDD